MPRQKFNRVIKFAGNHHTISHNGETYEEDVKGTGYFEVPHAMADHFVEAGFCTEYAHDLESAKLRHADEQRAANQNKPK